MIGIADHVVDLGPGGAGGTAGGTICFEGTVAGLRSSDTLTGRHLAYRAELKPQVRTPDRGCCRSAARTSTTCATSTSMCRWGGPGRDHRGGGRIGQELPDPRLDPPRDADVVSVDQTPIKGSRRSNPATYTGLLEPIRKAFAKANGGQAGPVQPELRGRLPDLQRRRGWSTPTSGVMATVSSVCEDCEGKRFQAEVLEYHLGGKNISEVLAMPVAEAAPVLRRGRGAYAGRRQDPGDTGGRRAGLPHPRSAADHPVRRRTAADQAGHPDEQEGRHLRARRTDRRAAPGRCGKPAGPAGPAGRQRQIGDRDRTPPGGDGACRLDHRPRSGGGGQRRRPNRLRGGDPRPIWSRTGRR